MAADHPGRAAVDQDDRQQKHARDGSSIARSSPSEAGSRASCTTRSNRGWPAFSCSSAPWRRRLDSSPQIARRALGIASEMLRYSLSEARRSVMDLRHGALETRDLAGALSDVAQQMTTGTSLDAIVRTRRPGAPARELGRAPPAADRPRGTDQYASSTRAPARVDVVLRFDDDAVHLVVTDDGTGFVDTPPRSRRRALRASRDSRAGRQDRGHAEARESGGRRGIVAVTRPVAAPDRAALERRSCAVRFGSCSSTITIWYAWGCRASSRSKPT